MDGVARRPHADSLPFNAYAHWLHTQWPAGTTEKLPAVHADGTTNVPGLFVVGDLPACPLISPATRRIERGTPGISILTHQEPARRLTGGLRLRAMWLPL
jgi:hypothetical protein